MTCLRTVTHLGNGREAADRLHDPPSGGGSLFLAICTMSIPVVCPGCRKRFEVSDQFAGKTGPCPHCKTPITIPKAEEQVVIHAPKEAAPGKTKTGMPTPKPTARKDAKFRPVQAAVIAAATIAVMVATLAARSLLQDDTWACWLLRAAGLLVISPPLVLGGYWFLRDDELEPYRGRQLYLRAAAVTLVFLVLWAGFGVVESNVLVPGEIWQWLFVAPPFFVIGALAALASLDLDFGSGFLLYSFYVVAGVLLRWLAGLGWIWDAGTPLT